MVLSTKILATEYANNLQDAGLQLKSYDAIVVQVLPFVMPLNIKNAIFTSQNALNAFLGHAAAQTMGQDKGLKVFCVGDKTAALATQNGLNVVVKAYNAADLAAVIIEKYPSEQFYFFCGDKRREALPQQLSAKGVSYKEIVAYRTQLQPQKQIGLFDAVLFFSPTGVQSHFKCNAHKGPVFCIGETTASEAKKYTDEVIVAKTPTIAAVVLQTINYFKHKNL